MEILSAKNLSFTYPECAESTVSHVSFSVDSGDFVCLCGATGSGKTTLLRMIKPELRINALVEGALLFKGREISSVSPLERTKIGYVMQNPDEQIVCDKVWHELCFGLENLGLSQKKIRMKLAEISAYFGLGELLYRDVCELSGGQKQLLNIASVMAMDPEVLLLDEPCAQLDPVSASSLTEMIGKLNRDLGTTVIISEHRLDEIIPLSNKILALDGGRVAVFDETKAAVSMLSRHPRLSKSMSAPVRLYNSLGESGDCPLTVGEGARYLRENFCNAAKRIDEPAVETKKEIALEFAGVYFRYTRNGADVLKNLGFSLNCGEHFCLLGENGCGKSTALLCAAGIMRPTAGRIRLFGKDMRKYTSEELYHGNVIYLPQDVRSIFTKNSVREELEGGGTVLSDFPFDFEKLLDRHPYDLSGGEAQLLAIAKALGKSPRLLLLDEPTKGLDNASRDVIGELVLHLTEKGVTVLSVTHDTLFASRYAHRCAMMFDGDISSEDTPREFFSANTYYTTPYSRMSRGFFDNAVTLEDVCFLCGKNGGVT